MSLRVRSFSAGNGRQLAAHTDCACPSIVVRSAHHFCYECYESWVSHKSSCPTCRAPVWSISHDAEFAKLIGAECSASSASGTGRMSEGNDEREGRRRIKLPAPAGLTIANSPAGCVVTKVIRGNGGDAAGIRAGDVILAVNGTHVRDHRQCVEFIERRCRVGDCEVMVKPRTSGGTELLRRGSSALLRGLTSPFERAVAVRQFSRRASAPTVPSHREHDRQTAQQAERPSTPRSPMAVDSPRASLRASPRHSRPSPLISAA